MTLCYSSRSLCYECDKLSCDMSACITCVVLSSGPASVVTSTSDASPPSYSSSVLLDDQLLKLGHFTLNPIIMFPAFSRCHIIIPTDFMHNFE